MKYRRSNTKGATFFFTVNLADRSHDLLTKNINSLRTVITRVREKHPFHFDAIVILPEHIHAIWTLPENDNNYQKRWMLIKSGFSRLIPVTEVVTPSRKRKGERGIWQRRYWEHQIRDEKDMENHVDYIHYNPVKHGYVKRAADWQYSSIHKYIRDSKLDENWGYDEQCDAGADFGERK